MKFKCIHTEQVYEFTADHDIQQMLKHPEYLAIAEAVEAPVEAPAKTKKQAKEA